MGKRRNYLEELKLIIVRDKATYLVINTVHIDDVIYRINREERCEFTCNCGLKHVKKIRQIIENSGLFCKKCTLKTKSEQIKKTCLKIYGVEHPTKNKEIKKKRKQFFLDKYGVENPSQIKEVREKTKQTFLDRYGVDNAFHVKGVKEKIKQTFLDRYGVENPSQNKKVKEKIKQTFLERYGVEHPSQIEEVKEKIKQVCLERYGVEHHTKNKEVRKKHKKTCMLNYGVECSFQNEEVRNKGKQTCMKRYGVEYGAQSEEFKKNVIETNMKKYGVTCTLHSEEFKEKTKQTNIKKYGVKHPMQNKEIFEKALKNNYKIKKYTFKTKQEITCQGYEPQALKYLEKHHDYFHEYYEDWDNHSFWYEHNNKKHRYYPDIPFLKNNLIIEVKSDYTFYKQICRNLKKALSVLNKDIRFEFWVYKGKSLEFVIDTVQMKNKFNLMIELVK